MPARPVFEGEKEAFLQDKLPGFRDAQGNGAVQAYLSRTYAGYLARWPVEGEEPEEEKEKIQSVGVHCIE